MKNGPFFFNFFLAQWLMNNDDVNEWQREQWDDLRP